MLGNLQEHFREAQARLDSVTHQIRDQGMTPDLMSEESSALRRLRNGSFERKYFGSKSLGWTGCRREIETQPSSTTQLKLASLEILSLLLFLLLEINYFPKRQFL